MAQQYKNRVSFEGKILFDVRTNELKDGMKVSNVLLQQPREFGGTDEVEVSFFGDKSDDLVNGGVGKGDWISVEGFLSRRSWKDKDDNWQEKVFIKAFKFEPSAATDGSSTDDNDIF